MTEDFERLHDKQEDDEDVKFSARLVVQELSGLKAQRACIFVGESGEVLHGQILGVLSEMDALIVRDLRPTRQQLRAKLLVPVEKIEHICTNEDRSKCKSCDIYAEIEAAMKGTGNEKADPKPGQDVRDPGGAPGDRPADQVGSPGGPPAG